MWGPRASFLVTPPLYTISEKDSYDSDSDTYHEREDEGYFSASPVRASLADTSDLDGSSVSRSSSVSPYTEQCLPAVPPVYLEQGPRPHNPPRRTALTLNFRNEGEWSNIAKLIEAHEKHLAYSRSIQILCWSWTRTRGPLGQWVATKDMIFISVNDRGNLDSLYRLGQHTQGHHLCDCSLPETIYAYGLNQQWNTTAIRTPRDFARAMKHGTTCSSTVFVLLRLMHIHEEERRNTAELGHSDFSTCNSCGGSAVYLGAKSPFY